MRAAFSRLDVLAVMLVTYEHDGYSGMFGVSTIEDFADKARREGTKQASDTISWPVGHPLYKSLVDYHTKVLEACHSLYNESA